MGDPMTDETIKKIKLWKLESYAYKDQVLKKLAETLKIPTEKVEELLAKNLDMARIESSHSSMEQAILFRLEKQIELDLGLDYLYHLELLDKEQVKSIKEEIIKELEVSGKLEINPEEYEKLIEEARKKIIKILEGSG
jgi:energy-converting hydrogenase A subunit M